MSPSDQPPTDREEIIPDRSDSLEFEPVVRTRPKKRFGSILFILVVIGGSAGAGWYFYGDKLKAGTDTEVPLIRAADGPVKIRPDNPGGMAIPDRDKLVYERLKGSEEDLRVERLLPPPETPLAPPAPETAKTKPAESAAAEKVVAEPIVNPATVPKIDEPVKVVAPPPAAPVVDVAKKAPAKIATVTPPVSASVYRVQLAAVRSEKAASGEWARLKKKNGDLLNALSLNVVRIDLGADKGIFYRLQAGPLENEAAAKTLCGQLSGRKIGCLIVRPGR